MKNLLLVTAIIISLSNCFSQQKTNVKVDSYDEANRNMLIDGHLYKVIQFEHVEGLSPYKMKEKEYNQYFGGDSKNKTFKIKKVFRVKPIGTRFFSENYILEYWVCETGKTLIIMQKVSINLKIKKT